MKVKRTYVGFLGLMLSAGVMAQKPVLSDDASTSWYTISSASSDASGLVMSDNSEQSPAFPIALLSADGSGAQQWKLVADEATGLVRFVNRESGRIIQPQSVAAQLYNVTQLGSAVLEGKGFELQDLGDGQYALSGAEADGVSRYLVSAKEGTAPASATAATAGSAFAWTFQLKENVVGIESAGTTRPVVRVVDGRVTVTPSAPVRIVTSDGVSVSPDSRLVAGVYLVTVGGETVKIVINK